ncbi:hypothetical protein [Campylobacter troglodytis]|uniref:hypothetical protein n=1 Tax=Campylobacter troglodytis TaxID=654363 RepID=UPI001156D45B|nr:hypothetical protein [Campylobacter troglodytis]TQR53634.1 hypothetical protein DMC01_11005 [Campylobacter troglodytis]
MRYFLLRVTRLATFQETLDLKAKQIAEICQIRHQSLCKIFKEICILIAKECEKLAKRSFFNKMSGEIEEGESYFLLRYTRNCKQKGQKECVVRVEVGLEKRHLCFYFVKPLVILLEGMLKR